MNEPMSQRFRTPRWRALLFGAAAFSVFGNCNARDLIVHAGVLIDGVGAAPRSQMSIVIRDDKIVTVENGYTSAPGADIVDLSKMTVMPGFIDCHVHVNSKLPSRARTSPRRTRGQCPYA